MGSKRAGTWHVVNFPSGVMATFLPHMLVQTVALFAATGGLIMLAFTEWSGLIFATFFLLFHTCLHYFIESTNHYVQLFSSQMLRITMQVVQSVFVVMGVIALGILFYELFQWCFFKVYNESQGGEFNFNWQQDIVSLAPPMLKVGLLGELIRQLFPLLLQCKKRTIKYFTTWD